MKFMFLILIVVSSPKSDQYIYYALRNKRSRQGQGRQAGKQAGFAFMYELPFHILD